MGVREMCVVGGVFGGRVVGEEMLRALCQTGRDGGIGGCASGSGRVVGHVGRCGG